jgi:N-formylglutamate deformylase
MMQTEMPVFKLRQGNSGLLISMPHVGTYLPRKMLPGMTAEALQMADTDWHLPLLYDFLEALDVTVLVATYSRYVIDLNRPPDNVSLYPGQNTTSLCPLDTFDQQPLYLAGCAPENSEIDTRITHFWQPYHQTLVTELDRLKALNGKAVLWDAHSIRSVVPRFFAGELPHLNIGSADNHSCAPGLVKAIADVALASGYTSVVNGRFKGGYITRQYGKPAENIHAIQLEIAMRSYMDESAPYHFDDAQATQLRPTLQQMVRVAQAWVQQD